MQSRPSVQVIAAIVVAVFAAGTWYTGDEINPSWLRYFSLAVFVATLALTIWDAYLWHISPVQRLLPRVPVDIRGTWRGTLTSFWIDPDTGKKPDPKTVFLVVRQKAQSVSVILLTDESKSVSSLATVSPEPGEAKLDYMFLNTPDARVEHRSRMHHGSSSLDITGRPATRLHGRYWTDRDTRGELDFTERSRHLSDDLDTARELFEDG